MSREAAFEDSTSNCQAEQGMNVFRYHYDLSENFHDSGMVEAVPICEEGFVDL